MRLAISTAISRKARSMSRYAGFLAAFSLAVAHGDFVRADSPGWNREAAAKVLDARAQAWFEFPEAELGTGETKSTCVSCHTLMPYALARSALLRATNATASVLQEKRLLASSRLRTANWDSLADAKFGLIYESPEQKRKESLGTEAVFHAAILATDDRAQRRTAPSAESKRAFENLWKLQHTEGPKAGTWDWLDFGLEPWESKHAGYYGASLAAIAVGTSPDYYAPGRDAAVDKHVALLKKALKTRLADENLYNQAWGLWASSVLKETLTKEERKAVVERLLAKQETDGGWRLASLGAYARSDGTSQSAGSDGYATGLVLHALHLAGVPKTEAPVAKGLAWLKANQAPTGEWRAASLNKNRDPDTHVGKFMSDAATAFAVLALTD